MMAEGLAALRPRGPTLRRRPPRQQKNSTAGFVPSALEDAAVTEAGHKALREAIQAGKPRPQKPNNADGHPLPKRQGPSGRNIPGLASRTGTAA